MSELGKRQIDFGEEEINYLTLSVEEIIQSMHEDREAIQRATERISKSIEQLKVLGNQASALYIVMDMKKTKVNAVNTDIANTAAQANSAKQAMAKQDKTEMPEQEELGTESENDNDEDAVVHSAVFDNNADDAVAGSAASKTKNCVACQVLLAGHKNCPFSYQVTVNPVTSVRVCVQFKGKHIGKFYVIMVQRGPPKRFQCARIVLKNLSTWCFEKVKGPDETFSMSKKSSDALCKFLEQYANFVASTTDKSGDKTGVFTLK